MREEPSETAVQTYGVATNSRTRETVTSEYLLSAP